MRIYHQKVKFLLALFLVNGGDKHAVGLHAHHGSRRKVGDGDAGLAHQVLRLIERMDAGQDGAVFAGAVIQGELQKLLGLRNCLAGLDLHGAEVTLLEGFEINVIRKERLDRNLAEIRLLRRDQRRAFDHRRCISCLRSGLLLRIQALQGRDNFGVA